MIRNLVWIGAALALPLAWFVVHFGQLATTPLEIALWSGSGIFGAAFLLSWTSEVAQLDITRALALGALYSLDFPPKATLSLFATGVLFLVFAGYVRAAGKHHDEEPELEGPAELLARLAPAGRRGASLALALVAGAAIVTAAEPFAESLIATGRQLGIEEFLLVQWLAPLVSESPEFVVAVLFALRGSAAASIGTLISSTVNQWTLLVGALPAAFALSHGSVVAMQLDARQREEIFLTSAQSVFGLVVIANLHFSRLEALVLFALFVPQLFLTTTAARWTHATLYLVLAAGIVCFSPTSRAGVRQLLPMRRRRPS